VHRAADIKAGGAAMGSSSGKHEEEN